MDTFLDLLWIFREYADVKGLVHRMKINPCFTHPRGILGVYDVLLSDESNQSYIKNYPCSSKLCNGSSFLFNSPKEVK